MAKGRAGATEAAYLAAEDASDLWALIRSETRFTRRPVKGRGTPYGYSHRLLYLMAVAVFRSVERLVPQPRWRELLDTVEAYADGEGTFDQLSDAKDASGYVTRGLPAAAAAAAWCVHWLTDEYKLERGVDFATDAVGYQGAVAAGVLSAGASLSKARAAWGKPAFKGAKRAHERALCGLIRDIFGNPFRPIRLAPGWRTADVLALARGVYDDRAFDRLPILADALVDAGCDDETVLAHCRSDGPHVRGCWVVDLVLGEGSRRTRRCTGPRRQEVIDG
jgi:hypothetical protein